MSGSLRLLDRRFAQVEAMGDYARDELFYTPRVPGETWSPASYTIILNIELLVSIDRVSSMPVTLLNYSTQCMQSLHCFYSSDSLSLQSSAKIYTRKGA